MELEQTILDFPKRAKETRVLINEEIRDYEREVKRIGEQIIDNLVKAPFEVRLTEEIVREPDGEYLHKIITTFTRVGETRPFVGFPDLRRSDRDLIEKDRNLLGNVIAYLKQNYQTTMFDKSKKDIQDFYSKEQNGSYSSSFSVVNKIG